MLPSGQSPVTFLLADLIPREPTSATSAGDHPTAQLITHWRTAVAAQAGTLLPTTTEGYQEAVFTTAHDALRAALRVWHNWRTDPQTQEACMPVRLALHTGPSAVMNGVYFGATRTRTARLLAIAPPGQTILSQATLNALGTHLPAGCDLHHCGTHRLGDLLPPEALALLTAPQLPSLNTALQTVDRYPNNLPTQPTTFIGREAECAALQAQLLRDEVRVVTLIAPSGMGKTRLAIDTATHLLIHFSEGVFFVDLAPISDPALVLPTIAHTLGLKDAPETTSLAQMQMYLRDRAVLLVLDNIEQVVTAAPELAELLAATKRLKLLVTSHVPLQITGEHVLPLPPLEFPHPGELPPPERLVVYPTIALFIERLQAVTHAVALDTKTITTIVHLCRLLGGVPLMLELVAGTGDALTPTDMLRQLTDHQSTLFTNEAQALQLQHVLDWCYTQLDRNTQTLYVRLGGFIGGCTLEGAEAICRLSEDEPFDIVNEIGVLLQRNLLLAEELAGSDPRYIMLDCIHDDASARLAACGEDEALRRRHVTYYRQLAETIAREMTTPQQSVWMQWIDGEQHNMRAAISWSLQQDDAVTALRICQGMLLYWFLRGHYQEGMRWYEQALARTEALSLRDRASGHSSVPMLYNAACDYARAFAHHMEALQLYRQLGDEQGIAITLAGIGYQLRMQGRYSEAKEPLEEAVQLVRRIGLQHTRPDTLALPLIHLGGIAMEQGGYASAEQLLAEALAVAQNADERVVVNVLLNQGLLAWIQGSMVVARQHLQAALRICQRLGGHDKLPALFDMLAGVLVAQGCAQQAAQLLGVAEAWRERMGQSMPTIVEGERYEQIVAQVRAQLLPDVFTNAWVMGRAFSFEQAMRCALDQS